MKNKKLKGNVDIQDHRAIQMNRKRILNKGTVTDDIKNHIKLFKPVVSHYKLTHCPKRRYLPQDISIRFLYDDYCNLKGSNKISFELYRHRYRHKMSALPVRKINNMKPKLT